jgi:phage baseplate assembly protein W
MSNDALGQDLDLGFVADAEGRVFAGPPSQVDLQARRRTDVAPRVSDLGVVQSHANLIQSLILRLKTERGELAPLGYPDYGSRHHQLIGEVNTEANRNLLKLYILECLRQEPRVARVLKVDVRAVPSRWRDQVTIGVSVTARDTPYPLSFVVPFSFDGGLE